MRPRWSGDSEKLQAAGQVDENEKADLASYRSVIPDSAEFEGQVSREESSKPNLGKSVSRGFP